MSMDDKNKRVDEVSRDNNLKDDGNAKVKQKSSLKGDFAVWFITLLILVVFGVVIYFLGRWGGIKKEYFATLTLPEDIRVGQKPYAQLTFDNDYAVINQEIVWMIDDKEVKRGKFGNQEILSLPLSNLDVGEHKIVVLAKDKTIAQESFVVNKPILKITLPKVNLYYGQKLKEPLNAVATGWLNQEDANNLGFDGAVAFDDDKLKVGKYDLDYDAFCCDKYEVQVNKGYVNVIPLKVQIDSASFDKVYDGTTTIQAKNVKLKGVLEGDELYVNLQTEFLDKKAGKNKRIKVVDCTLLGKDAQNYEIDLKEIDLKGNITPIKLTIEGLVAMDKVYDGTTSVTFNNGGELKGVIQGDLVSVGVINASFVDPNKGENKRVIIKSVSLVGVDSINYQVEATETTASIFGKKTSVVHGSN